MSAAAQADIIARARRIARATYLGDIHRVTPAQALAVAEAVAVETATGFDVWLTVCRYRARVSAHTLYPLPDSPCWPEVAR